MDNEDDLSALEEDGGGGGEVDGQEVMLLLAMVGLMIDSRSAELLLVPLEKVVDELTDCFPLANDD